MKKSAHNPLDSAQNRAAAIYRLLSSSPAKAFKEARIALKAYPKNERVQFVSGLVMISRGKKEQARQHFANAIRLGTATPDAYINLAQLSAEAHKLDLALETLARAQERFSNDPRILAARITVFRIAGDTSRALEAAAAALSENPGSVETQHVHAVLLSENGRLLDAISELEALLLAHPNHVESLVDLGRYYAYTNQPVRSLVTTQRAYDLSASVPSIVQNLAIRKLENGDLQGAAASFRELISLSSEHACAALMQLADIVEASALDALSQSIATYAKQARSPQDKSYLNFAQAAVAKRLHDDTRFTKSLKTANQLMAKIRPYDAQFHSQMHKAIQEQYRADEPEKIENSNIPAVPVFVMGMPRSGTTLLERMLSAAPDVAGLGEVALINRQINRALAASSPIGDVLPDLRAGYAKYQKLAGAAQWTIDKMPSNYTHMGWINAAFPEAKLILLRRDEKDLALSLYENYFDDNGLNFTFSEQGIQHQINLFEDCVAEWSSLGASFLELDYEALVRDPQASLSKVCAYCDIPFSEEMLSPEKNKGSIRTASSIQARREINQDSIARWTKYPDLLPNIFR